MYGKYVIYTSKARIAADCSVMENGELTKDILNWSTVKNCIEINIQFHTDSGSCRTKHIIIRRNSSLLKFSLVQLYERERERN